MWTKRTLLWLGLASLGVLTAGCDEDNPRVALRGDGAAPDALPRPDRGPDLGPDAAPPLPDLGPDLGPDAEPPRPDLGPDLGPDAEPPRPDLGPDQGPDAEPPLPDLGPDLGPDAEPPLPDVGPDEGPDAAPPCVPPAPIPSPPAGELALVPLRQAAVIGGPPLSGTLAAADFEGDGLLDIVVVRGGRLEAITADGSPRWQTAVTGANRIGGVVDLDGDARLEVIAIGPRTVVVYDALTGERRWTLPEDPLGEAGPAFVAVTVVFLQDVDRDGRVDLYVTDGSCTFDGPGNGILYRFLDGLENPVGTPVLGPRSNGRCTTSQTLTDWDGDGQLDLLLNDARGLNLFDLTTGQRRLCGAISGVADGVLPHLSGQLLPELEGRELVVLRADGLRLVGLSDEAREDCPDAPALRTRWFREGDYLPDVVTTLDVDGDGRPEVIVSRQVANRWRTEALDADTGALVSQAFDLALRGRIDLPDGPALLLTDNPTGFGAVQIARLTPEGLAPLWAEPLPGAAFAVRAARPTEPGLSLLLAQAQVLRTPAGPRAVLIRDTEGDGLVDSVQLGTADGPGPLLNLQGSPGALHVTCDPQACADQDLLLVGAPDGAILTLEGDLSPRIPAAAAPIITAGRVRLSVAQADGPVLIARTANNVIGAVDLDRPDAPFTWSLSVGGNLGSDPFPFVVPVADAPDSVVLGAGRFGPTTWLALDAATGEERWRSALIDPVARPPEGAALQTPDGGRFIRLDAFADGATFRDLPGCPAPTVVGDVRSPDPICAGRPLNPRVISAYDALTGACLWQTQLRPVANCAGRANQRVSAADTDADGWPEIYVTESVALHQLDAATGALLATVDLRADDAPSSGGGRVIATGDAQLPALLVGGNGPPEARAADLSLGWAGALPPGLDGRAWLNRQALILGDEIWTSPGGGWPLDRYARQSANPAEPLTRLGLADGVAIPDAPAENRYAEVTSLQRLTGLGPDGGEGVVATTDEAWLYGLTDAGELAWSRPLPAQADPPLTGDLNADGLLDLVIPLADGQILLGEAQTLIPPPRIYDRPCDATPLCAPDDTFDLAVVPATDTLCAAWVPILEADRYEARITTFNGTPRTGWIATEEPYVAVGPLALVPGARYRVEVRAQSDGPNGEITSDTSISDGVRVVDAEPPLLALRVEPPEAPTGSLITLTVEATDDDRVASRRLEIINEDGVLQWFADLEEQVLVAWQGDYVWDGRDRDGALAPAGRYRARASVGDRAGNRVVVEAPLRLCDGPCVPE